MFLMPGSFYSLASTKVCRISHKIELSFDFGSFLFSGFRYLICKVSDTFSSFHSGHALKINPILGLLI